MAVTKQLKIGNGGANYNTAEATLKRQIAQNQSNIANNVAYKQNETQRALQVIQQRQAAGLDTSAQQKYLTTNLGYKAPTTTQAQPTAVPYKPVNTQSANTQQGSELMSLMKQIATKQATPFDYDVQSDPEYKAALQRAQANIKTGTNQTMAEMNRRGILNSTITSDRSDEIAADQMGRVETEVVPALVNQAYQRYQNEQSQQQQQLSNMATLAQMYQGEDQRGFGNRVTEAGLTGNYMPEGAQTIVDNILSLKQQAEAKGVTAQQRAQYSAQADGLRAQLLSMGVNPNAYAANVNSTAARAVNPGIRTLQAQQQDLAAQNQAFNQNLQTAQYNQGVRQYDQNFAYQVARDAITDKQWQAAFDRDVSQFGMNYALQSLQERNNQAYRQASLALQQDDNLRQWADLDYKQANPSGASGGLTANQVLQSMQGLYSVPVYGKNADGDSVKEGTKITTDKSKRQQMFQNVVDAGLSDAETRQVLSSLGMSKKEIDDYKKLYQGN
ncbi:hypothetical protein H7K28_06705 [Paenibacillus polymyxa]|jgi:hypothetical protein|uniref:hypothetical protein n=1 Tax=Paenibacillus polymyxa TaxID=1406 RepID=UPI001580B13F|nr:hypothetical protein [Paenibacillus polymyxa]MBY0020721.1 hypothetical protein [Paenibacillus polymyxa]MBY0059025.1 hypothetical protein [Paenibacillus polymyxa]MBY0069612.1 hypothetical protein [Paenibacillus polymyxa]MBY0078854.1 hypothetical protein [Paenibacillus polymyxa]MBZ6441872.1 hypothetical protein [Paenibacillus polymyxa]